METSEPPRDENTSREHEIATSLQLSDFQEKLRKDPDEAIDEIVDVYENALNRYNKPPSKKFTIKVKGNYRNYVGAENGRPPQLIPDILYNSIGEVYPSLNRYQKNKALKQIFSILDRENSRKVRWVHTSVIRNPQLLSDILVCRMMYMPDLEDIIGENSLSHVTAKQMEDLIDNVGLFKKNKVKSDFLAAYVLLRKDINVFAEEYARAANPQFLEEVLEGIAALESRPKKREWEGKKKAKDRYPDSVHERILELKKEANWVNSDNFETK